MNFQELWWAQRQFRFVQGSAYDCHVRPYQSIYWKCYDINLENQDRIRHCIPSRATHSLLR